MYDEDHRGDPQTPEEAADEVGAENEHDDQAPVPFAPHKDDDSPFGDTDQHSDA